MTGLAVREPSPSDWDQWIQRLIAGEEPASAARAVAPHLTSSMFKRQDPGKHAAALELSREVRGGADRELVRDKLREVTADIKHPQWAKSTELLARSVGMLEDRQHLEVSGGMEVTSPDVAAAIDRFTALTDAAVRALASAGSGSASGDADGSSQGELGVPVARLDRAPEPT